MRYSVHVGPREVAWPDEVGAFPTREQAQNAAKHLLAAAPASVTKAEVRCRVVLLDTYGKRPTGTIRHLYEAKQRAATTPTLPLEDTARCGA